MRAWLLLLLLGSPAAARADQSAAAEPTYPYRTDAANEQLPWYQLKPGEFPPHGSEHRVGGELVEADFIHRSGQFRTNDTRELVDFTLPAFGCVSYLNVEADLRDVPLGTCFLFYLYQDEQGAFTKVAAMQDEYTALAAHGLTYRLDEAKLEDHKLNVTRQNLAQNQADLGRSELLVSEQTRVWKGDKQVKLSDLAVGDQLLVNLTGSTPHSPGRCCDLWVGIEAHKLATDGQRKKHIAFLKQRGLPAWIDRVEGKNLTVTLFGDPAGMQALFKDEGIVPSQWATEHRSIDAVVANAELRTYNPPVDRQASIVQEFQGVPTQCYGSSGVRWIIEPRLLIEGFRKGEIVRLFAHPSWPVEDMPFGESMYTEVPYAKNEREEPLHFPYRTDFANEHLPWYTLKPGVFPPFHSHHLVGGELTKVDAAHRSGQFRTDRTGKLVDFTMPPFGSVLFLNADAELADVPLATHCQFYLHQDDRGAFTKASVVMDEYTRLSSEKYTYRLVSAKLGAGKLLLARQHALVKNYKEDLVRPPDLGDAELAVDDKTRVWKRDQPLKLSDLAVGDELLINLTGRTATSRGRCTDVWVGLETHKLATDEQRTKHNAWLKERGLAAWIDSAEGKQLTITFFCGNRNDFRVLLDGDPWGKSVYATLVDEELRPYSAAVDQMKFVNHLPEGNTAGTYGSSGVRWVIESEQLPEGYRPGKILRVFKEGWPTKQFLADEPLRP